MLTDTIKEPKHKWVIKGDIRIKAVADKAKREGYRVWLSTESACFPEGTYGFVTNKNESKLIYFQMDEFKSHVYFCAELVPSRECGSGYQISDEMTTVEQIEKELDFEKLFDCVKPQKDRNGKIHEVLSLKMKMSDPWGLRSLAEY